MSDFLAQMARLSRSRADRVQADADGTLPVRPLVLAGFDVIAEVKLQAPSVGVLRCPDDPLQTVVAQAVAYESGGAAAISVLTEPDRFGGHLDHLRAVAEAVGVPVMRKDFLVDPCQVHEARAAGASGVLLILAMLDDSALEACVIAARSTGMFVLLEAFDQDDLQRAADHLGPGVLLGLNCRNLRTLEVEPTRLHALLPSFPQGAIPVAESGIRCAADAADVASAGYRLALIGTALMKAADPEGATAEMVRAGREGEMQCASA